MTVSITDLKGIGEKTGSHFKKLGLFDTKDLIRYYPRDYDRMPEIKGIADAVRGEDLAVYARVLAMPTVIRAKNYTILSAEIADGSGRIGIRFYNMPYLKKVLKPGTWRVFRAVPRKKGDSLVLDQPRLYDKEEYAALENSLRPVYPLSAHLTNKGLQKAIAQALQEEDLEEYLPEDLREGLPSYEEAVRTMHFPESMESIRSARDRLVFDEFLLFLLNIRRLKRENEEEKNTHPMIPVADCKRLMEALPYRLTEAQLKVYRECEEDCLSDHVMCRLIQGDVGSGKTILAILMLLMTVANGYQGALMAPTEVLAVQHYEGIKELTEKYKLPFVPVLLTGSVPAAAKKASKAALLTGEANLAIGTHAVIQDNVQFKDLALVITDEQHRFGVRQREKLSEKGTLPHTVVMSATPIPRTLALILYGDLHISVIDELPKNRLPIKNAVIPAAKRTTALQFLVKRIQEGRQAYVICPMIAPSEGNVDPELCEEGDLMNVEDYSAYLRRVLPETIRISTLHGKMKPAEKNRIMQEFSEGQSDVLVSTTVVEVGVNVPNAAIMIIENAERYGLAALHQLRGRVGRGSAQSHCIFIAGNEKKETMERLNILAGSNNGFEIAEKDLSLRGPGEFFGLRQSGELPFVLADIYQDAGMLKRADQAAGKLLNEDPELTAPEHAQLKAMLGDAAGHGVYSL